MAILGGIFCGMMTFCTIKAINPNATWWLIPASISAALLGTWAFKYLDDIIDK